MLAFLLATLENNEDKQTFSMDEADRYKCMRK